MTPAQTAATYDKIAKHWDNPDFDRSNGIAQHHRALGFVSTFGSALDVGCGSSGRIESLLLQQGFSVEAIDLSSEMLRRAKLHNPSVTFHHADICQWTLPRTYDFISAWDSIWHVPLDAQLGVVRKLCAGLSVGGVLILTSGGVYVPDEVVGSCFGHPLYHAAPGIPALLSAIQDTGCLCRHLEFDAGPNDKHVYLIAQRA
ncbi:MAG: class I SAM-dependent methyltransferase [Rhodanobacteraceae bacterium]|nr:class I SAM-dependent methyltransferase [Rhodanobacteraceae bacterium]